MDGGSQGGYFVFLVGENGKCAYPRMLCHVFWSQVEYKIVCFIIWLVGSQREYVWYVSRNLDHF